MALSFAIWIIKLASKNAAVATWIWQPFWKSVFRKHIPPEECQWVTFTTIGNICDISPEDPSAPLHLCIDKMFYSLAGDEKMSKDPRESRGFTLYHGGKTNGDTDAA